MGMNNETKFRDGDGYLYRQDSGGGSLEILPQVQRTMHPFKVTLFSEDGVVKYRVWAGTVNNKVPTLNGTKLDATPVPSGTIGTGSLTMYIYIEAQTGSPPAFFPNSVTITNYTEDKTDTDTVGYLKIAAVVLNAGSIQSLFQFVYASQALIRVKPGNGTALWSFSSR